MVYFAGVYFFAWILNAVEKPNRELKLQSSINYKLAFHHISCKVVLCWNATLSNTKKINEHLSLPSEVLLVPQLPGYESVLRTLFQHAKETETFSCILMRAKHEKQSEANRPHSRTKSKFRCFVRSGFTWSGPEFLLLLAGHSSLGDEECGGGGLRGCTWSRRWWTAGLFQGAALLLIILPG